MRPDKNKLINEFLQKAFKVSGEDQLQKFKVKYLNYDSQRTKKFLGNL